MIFKGRWSELLFVFLRSLTKDGFDTFKKIKKNKYIQLFQINLGGIG